MNKDNENKEFKNLTYKPEEGFQNTINILEEIRRNVIDNIQLTEGPPQLPSLCPVLFYLALPFKGKIYNVSNICYEDLYLAPWLNELLHKKIYHSYLNERIKRLNKSKINELNLKVDKEIIKYMHENDEGINPLVLFRDIWGDWRAFDKSQIFIGETLSYQFDNLTIDLENKIGPLTEILENIKSDSTEQEILVYVDIVLKIIDTRRRRREAFKEIQNKIKSLDENIIQRIIDGIRSHPRHLSEESKNKAVDDFLDLKKWLSEYSFIGDEFNDNDMAKKILYKIITVFKNLAQEIDSSKAFTSLVESCNRQYDRRYDFTNISLKDLLFFPIDYNPWPLNEEGKPMSSEEKAHKFPLYYILDSFEQIFYGQNKEVSYIIYSPIRSLPTSGLAIGQAVSINIDRPDLMAHLQALERFQNAISQALIIDVYNSIQDDILSLESHPTFSNIIGKNIYNILPVNAIFILNGYDRYLSFIRNDLEKSFFEYSSKTDLIDETDENIIKYFSNTEFLKFVSTHINDNQNISQIRWKIIEGELLVKILSENLVQELRSSNSLNGALMLLIGKNILYQIVGNNNSPEVEKIYSKNWLVLLCFKANNRVLEEASSSISVAFINFLRFALRSKKNFEDKLKEKMETANPNITIPQILNSSLLDKQIKDQLKEIFEHNKKLTWKQVAEICDEPVVNIKKYIKSVINDSVKIVFKDSNDEFIARNIFSHLLSNINSIKKNSN